MRGNVRQSNDIATLREFVGALRENRVVTASQIFLANRDLHSEFNRVGMEYGFVGQCRTCVSCRERGSMDGTKAR